MTGFSGTASNSALFLDFDGTLVEIAATPEGVRVDPALVPVLRRLAQRLDGALAIVSGRPIEQIDAFLAPLRLPAAGVHGAELRTTSDRPPVAATEPLDARLRAAISDLARLDPAIRIEPKTYSTAVHFRQAGHLAGRIEQSLRALVENSPTAAALVPGRMVFEVTSGLTSKGGALATLMRQPPFAGRRPIMIGDDVTDRSALTAAEAMGGRGLKVAGGAFSPAESDFDNPQQVRAWLATLAERMDR